MKQILRNSILGFILASVVGITAGAIGIDNRTCDVTFYKDVRLGRTSVGFPDNLFNKYKPGYNPTKTYVHIPTASEMTRPVYIHENYGDDINGDFKYTIDDRNSFNRTTKFKNETKRDTGLEYLMKAPPVGGEVKYEDAVEYTPGYAVKNKPKERKLDNLVVVYSLAFTDADIISGKFKRLSSTRIHTECLNVEVTWCGDGILDTKEGETCDDGNNINGDGCSATCTTEPVVPTCDSLSVSKSDSDRSAFVTCNATNASSYSINCGNGQIIDSATGKCQYPAGTMLEYDASCTVNGSVTSQGCNSKVDFTNAGNVCGDGEVNSSVGETCDDGNTVSGDGCSSTCQTEGNGGGPACNSLTVVKSQNEGSALITCNASDATSYSIDCGNGQTINAETGRCEYGAGTRGTFNAKCTINGSISSSGCESTVDFSNGGGDGNDPACVTTTVTDAGNRNYNVSCTGSKANTYEIDCGNGVIIDSNTGNETCTYGGVGTFDVSCTVNGQYTSDSCNPQVVVNNGNGTNPNGGGVCGDGNINTSQGETCDDGNTVNGDGCSSTCKLEGNEGNGSNGGPDGSVPVITSPESLDIRFEPTETVILGYEEEVFTSVDDTPKVINNTGNAINIDKKLCVYNMTNGVVVGEKVCSNDVVGTLPSGGSKSLSDSELEEFRTKNHGATGNPFKSSTLKVTLEGGQNSRGSEIKVIVSAPTITNIGGGTAFGKYYGVTNLSQLGAQVGFESKNKNFVTTYISTGFSTKVLSSYDDSISRESSIVTKAEEDKDKDVKKFEGLNDSSSVGGSVVPSTSLPSYNGIKNTYFVKGKNLYIDSSNPPEGGKTYIVEGGDIIFVNPNSNGEITYTGSTSAFVATTGNVRIDNSVKNIKGVLMSLKGEIMSNNGDTLSDNPLVIEGAMYGKLNNIVSRRTRIKYDNNTGLIDVGTIVDFNSSVFVSPPPLLGTLVNEYIEIEKVAK